MTGRIESGSVRRRLLLVGRCDAVGFCFVLPYER